MRWDLWRRERPASPRPSFAEHVARPLSLAIGLGSVVSALTMGVVADRLLSAEADARLMSAARVFAFELQRARAAPERIAVDESAEQAAAGLRVVAYDLHGRFRGGDGRLPVVARERCVDHGLLRACGVAAGPELTAIAAGPRPVGKHWRFLAAGGIAAFVVSMLGQLVSQRLARKLVSPLAELEAAVAELTSGRDAAVSLATPVAIREVESLRQTIHRLACGLMEAAEQARRFAGNAAHELRTPLTSILGELELLAEEVDLGDEPRRELKSIQGTATHLAQLVERLLLLATPGADLLSKAPLRIQDLLLDARRSLPAESRHLVIVEPVAQGCQTPWVMADQTLLMTLLTNAMDNAQRYAPNGVIRLRGWACEGYALLEIDDEGPGIAPELRERLFEPFYRGIATQPGHRRGYGIGLALVAHIARVHGGHASFVDGALGARLRVRLPNVDELPGTRPGQSQA